MGTKILSAAIRDEYCRGCKKFKDCPARADLNKLNSLVTRRLGVIKYYRCHTLFEEATDREPDKKRDRREHGESGVQY